MATTTIKFKITYTLNETNVISSYDFVQNFLFGIPLCTPNGRGVDLSIFISKINAAQKKLENSLGIKFNPTFIKERRDFIKDNFGQWGFLRCTYPIREVKALEGYYSHAKIAQYPIDWCSLHETNQEGNHYRNLHIVPASTNSAANFTAIFIGINFFAISGNGGVPNYWNVEYYTGFKKIPEDLLDYIGKESAIQSLAIVGDILKGIGVASTSISFDGLSQSQSLTQSGASSLFGARIKQYQAENKDDYKNLEGTYKGLNFEVC